MATPSPIKPSDVCSTVPETTGSICSKLEALWSLANKMCDWFTWWEDSDGFLSDEAKDFLAESSVPVGSMVFWPLDVPPEGWLTANGDVVSRTTYAKLFAKYGVKYGVGDGTTTFGLPNLERRFPFGRSGSNVAGQTGGSENTTLNMGHLPAQPAPLGDGVDRLLIIKSVAVTDDTVPEFGAVVSANGRARTNAHSDHADNVMGDLGNGDPLDILNPYFSGAWIIKI